MVGIGAGVFSQWQSSVSRCAQTSCSVIRCPSNAKFGQSFHAFTLSPSSPGVQYPVRLPAAPSFPSLHRLHISHVPRVRPFMCWLPTATQPPHQSQLLFLRCRIHCLLLYRCRLTLALEYPRYSYVLPHNSEFAADLDQTPPFKSHYFRSTTSLRSRFCGCRSLKTALHWTSPMQMR